MRIGIARISQETNTFSPLLTDVDTLRVHGLTRGEEVLRGATGDNEIAGFLDVVGGEELVGVISAHAGPAGPMTDETVRTVAEWFVEELERVGPLDGLLLALHGALAGVSEPDVEGLVLELAREVGGDRTPIGASLDMHANLTARMVRHADVIRGYHTHPHRDSRETGRMVAEMLVQTIRGEIRPVMRAVKIPMITPADLQNTEEGPMTELFAAIRRFQEAPGALSASLFAVQPWLDIPELGWCSLAVTDRDPELADRFAGELADLAWAQRNLYLTSLPTHRDALDEAFAADARPVVISDLADSTTGGATGDSTWYLAELIARNPEEKCYLTMVDPDAVQRMTEAGAGATVTGSLGGKQDAIYSKPVEVTGRVVRLLPMASGRKLPERMGTAAVLSVGQIYLVVSERPGPGSSPSVYTGAGLDPADAKLLVAKSPMDFRADYRGIARRFLLGEAPGLTPSNLRLLRFERAPRPIFPFEEFAWTSKGQPRYRGRGG